MSRASESVPRAAWLAAGMAAGAGVAAAGAGGAAPAGALVPASPATITAIGALLVATAVVLRAGPAAARRGTATLALGLGLLVIGVRLLVGPAQGVPPALPDGSRGPWTAIVESVGSPRDGDQVARLRLTAEAGTVIVAGTLPPYPVVTAGTLVEVAGRLRPPPDDDPYGEYLRRTGASGSLDATSVRVLESGPPASLQAWRDAAGDALRRSLPEPEAGLAAGILIGLRERVDRELAKDFATAGASHVVAISGWNIAIVAGIVAAVMRGRPRRMVALVVGGTIAAYVVAAGASPSVVRAAVMAAVVLLARESGRAGRAPAALAWAAAILLLVSPSMIEDAGFRLSVLATAGLLAWATPLGERIGRLGGGRVPRWLAESLGISLAAQAATLPDVLATFGRLSLVAPVVNLAVVPLVPAAMAGGVLALLAGAMAMTGAPAWVATLAGLPGWLVLHVIVAVVRLGAGIPYAAVELPPELAVPLGLATAAGLGALVAWRRRVHHGSQAPRPSGWRPPGQRPPRRPVRGPVRVALVALAIVVAIGSTAVAQAATRATRLTVLDVGQGDAILLESRTGARMLVDGGPDPQRLLVELDARVPPWDRRLDVVVLTHPHEDHAAGLVAALERYAVRRVYEPGMRGPGPAWRAWDERLVDGPPRGTLAAGARISLGEIALVVLWPDPGSVPREPPDSGKEINNHSIVLLGEANGRRFLLLGDAEEDVDPELLGRGLPRLDVLKVAHHGSATATSEALLDATRPTIAAISVGEGNTYGHPAPSTLSRLRNAGVRVYRTDLDGSIELELRETGVGVRAAGGGQRAAGSPGGAAPEALLGYDPDDDRPGAPRGRPAAALPRAVPEVPAPRLRGRGRRRLARVACGGQRPRRGPAARGDGGAAARRGQAGVGRDARPPPSRRGVGGMAGGERLPGAGPGGPGPPRDAPRRAGP